MVHIERRDPSRAKKYLLQAGKLGRKIRDREVLRKHALFSGELALLAGSNESARRRASSYADRALELAEDMESKAGRAEALLLQARVFSGHPPFKKGDKRDFNNKFIEPIKIFKELKLPFDLARAYFYYAESMGDRAKGKKYIQKAKKIFKKLGAKGWLAKIAEAFKND